MAKRSEVLEKLNYLETVFSQLIEKSELYRPEFEGARRIRLELEKGSLSGPVAENVVRIYNEANERDHQDGLGWRDYREGLQQLYALEGYTVHFAYWSGEMTLKKSGPAGSLGVSFPFSVN